ncbi:hypothetical protein L6452_28273 [Arctium lappa]|uniref:Uncharacterized protein n=1 Tax=Arctium lappa TaxID=4217 RepID=A0ACB8ZY88_ARCLA|nr:hypothetical protein L6452_28273 [Arctium lappa]
MKPNRTPKLSYTVAVLNSSATSSFDRSTSKLCGTTSPEPCFSALAKALFILFPASQKSSFDSKATSLPLNILLFFSFTNPSISRTQSLHTPRRHAESTM